MLHDGSQLFISIRAVGKRLLETRDRVAEELRNRDVRVGKFRPVLADRIVEIDLATLGAFEQHDRSKRAAQIADKVRRVWRCGYF